jgi:histone-lysine N-methyltransferase SETMAR
MCELTQEVGSQKRKGKMQMWTQYEQMVNRQWYLEVLIRLRESVRRKRPKLWPDKWVLHHDNAPAHDALRVRKFLAKKSITKMDHPPYSPDLAPCDFWFFSKIKNALGGQRFADIPDIQCNVTLLWGIPENNFQDCFWQWSFCINTSSHNPICLRWTIIHGTYFWLFGTPILLGQQKSLHIHFQNEI